MTRKASKKAAKTAKKKTKASTARAGKKTRAKKTKKTAPRSARTLEKKVGAGARADERGKAAAGSKTKLLSGGNPQLAKGDGDAVVRTYIEAMPDWKRNVGRALDALIVRTVPGVRKAVRWNSPFYGVEGQGWFLSYHCFTKYVKVVFLRGDQLRPVPPVGSAHPHTRYYHIHEGQPVDEELLGSWIAQASTIPGEPMF